jgi:hypothetical protein
MAATASDGAAGDASMISDSVAYKIRKEICSGKYKSGIAIDETAMAGKRLQYAAWEAARNPGKGVKASKWNRHLGGIAATVRADGGATRALVTSEAVETREALAPIAEGVTAVRDMFLGKEVPRHPGQTTKERLKQLRLIKTVINGECKDLCEEEAVRMRDLLGETSDARASREAKEAKVKDRDAAKATKKADADAKRGNNAKEKADAKVVKEKAKATPKTRAKATPKTRATATGSVAQSAPVLATVDDMEAEQKKAKTQEDVKAQDKFWDKFRKENPANQTALGSSAPGPPVPE